MYQFRNLWHSSTQEERPCKATTSAPGSGGVFRVAKLGYRWDMTPNDAHHRLQILHFLARHGLAAASEAFGVSRRALYT